MTKSTQAGAASTTYFSVACAMRYGIPGAILLQRFAFWMKLNQAKDHNCYDGRVWTYITIRELAELYPYWNETRIWRILNHLVEEGALVKGNYNKQAYNRTIWYSVEPEAMTIMQDCNIDVSHPKNECCKTERPITGIDTVKDAVGKEEDAQTVVTAWNTQCVPALPRAKVLSKRRQSVIEARIADYGLDAVVEVVATTARSPFLCGDNPRHWRATIDWVMAPTNFIKVMEGNYEDCQSSERLPENVRVALAGVAAERLAPDDLLLGGDVPLFPTAEEGEWVSQ